MISEKNTSGAMPMHDQLQDGSPQLVLLVMQESDQAEDQQLAAPWPHIRAARQRCVPLLSLLAWCGEGDNVADAMRLAEAAARVVDGSKSRERDADPVPTDWKLPISWQSLFGRSPPEAIY